jgi:hypothetical protein
MAAFNGSDAYIALDNDILTFNKDFIIDVDIRLNVADGWMPVFGRAGLGGFIGMDGSDVIYGGTRRSSSWTPVADEWFNWRMEFEQSIGLTMIVYIDDVEVSNFATNRMNVPINRIGVYKQGASGSLWTNGDFKNMKLWMGDPPSTDVELDMPLFENALDSGPKANHGTTFNMALPSV